MLPFPFCMDKMSRSLSLEYEGDKYLRRINRKKKWNRQIGFNAVKWK
jgi:hypothetical protein